MRLTFRTAVFAAVLFATPCVAFAAQEEGDTRLLTRSEGASLVKHALDYRVRGRKPDCSHLMYDVLTSAGLEYSYATSTEIYSGIPQFRRVRKAQVGDLIVWRGHVGLVVDPVQRTFYSSTRSGLTVDEYTSNYWRRRGTARFYRYIVTNGAESPLRHALNADAGDSGSLGESMAPEGERMSAAESRPGGAVASYNAPKSIQVATDEQPSKADIEEAVSELSVAAARMLEADRDTFLLLVRDLKVKKVQTKGDSGWAEIQVRSAVELEPNGAWKKVKIPKQRWELRRSDDGWTLFVPAGPPYVAQAAAIPILEQRLPLGSDRSVRATDAGGVRMLLALLRKENPQRVR